MITRTFKLCLNAGTGSAPYINVNQYDKGETWLFELYTEQGERYMPTTGAIIGIKSDGHGIANTGTVDSNGRVVITETEQMTAAAGLAIFELSIDELTHGTANFAVQVERKPTDDAIMSDSDYSMFQEAIDAAEVINDVIGDGDPSEVIGEHVDAWLDNHPEATTTVQDGAITAPKINNSLWDKILVNEEVSGNPASFDDGADDVPVSSLKVALEPIQTGSGDPSPSNVRPIIAANGINVWDEEWELGSLGASGQPKSASNSIRCKNFIPVKAGETYRYVNESETQQAPWYYDSSQNFVSRSSSYIANGNTFVIPSGVAYMKFALPAVYGDTYKGDISFNYPSTYIGYRPYQGIMVERTRKNIYTATLYKDNRGLNGSGEEYSSSSYRIDRENLFPNTQYTISLTYTGSSVSQAVRFQFYDVIGEVVGSLTSVTLKVGGPTTLTFTTPSQTAYAHISINKQTENIQLEYGTTASAYEPYQPTSYPYSLGREVYGGSVDLATGVLTVTWGTITLDGSEAWSNGDSNQGWYTQRRALAHLIDYSDSIICDRLETYRHYAFTEYINADSGITGFFDILGKYPTTNWIYAKGGGATTVEEFKTWLASNPLQVVYILATPTTINLTPTEVKTLLGYNNISSTGTVDVIYHADTKLYVDKMTAVDNNIIAPTEEGFTATRNYTVNDLVIVNDTLYKVTANIASGSAITPNSNVQQTTLGALIKALS